MAQFCYAFRLTPAEYRQLTMLELDAFAEVATPQTDLTGLF
jgi:hypothetical protein